MQDQPQKLTLKQQKWKEAYLKHGNATQAAVDAGYKCKNRFVARAIGSENLLKPYIKGEIELHKAEIRAKSEISIIDQQISLIRIAEKAEAEGKYTAAAQARATILKSIGGFIDNRPNPEAMRGKELDAKKLDDLRRIAELYYGDQYLAKPVEQPTVLDLRPLAGPTMDDRGENVQGQGQAERSEQNS